MWNNPRLLNTLAAVLAAAALTALGYAGVQWLLRSALFPLHEVTLKGRLAHTARDDVERAARGRVRGNFFAVDLAEIRTALEALPWVRGVRVRRVWPDRIEVAIEEHVALAHWGEHALVNTFGERFNARSDAPLPRLDGPEGSAAEVAARYLRFGEILAPLGLKVQRVALTPRFAWRLTLDSGLQVELGRDVGDHPVELRLARFAAAYPLTLARLEQRHDYVDLRYPNGFALRVRGLEAESAAEPGPKG
ncbi:MAG: cell division protein FtsQ/DivIB [Burkholderiales bacterium]|nr:cell division protein FtsQ/DivIB [Burkholderiales bacterium]